MLQDISYAQYYKALTLTDRARLAELFEVATLDRLPAPAIYILELEKAGYFVDLSSGMVWLDLNERGVVDCGQITHFYSLLDRARVIGMDWGWRPAAAGQGGEVGR